jgi:hypothetical protein
LRAISNRLTAMIQGYSSTLIFRQIESIGLSASADSRYPDAAVFDFPSCRKHSANASATE